ncbi:unnamed protein product [Didymodactylos carnosus]|uniref:Peptidase M28 domain-containing protein n=1 Tax=Didymodactylos carnosus TaxID=1234261 RepID=A0A814TJG8_9BILA|nr:unnamed protein product [Didymodactylos carnosus]CAF1160563.1 unnamed protein product [Didymodactylos carnosus]CAF3726211.1 unnamed protein product [Didymodactylos carnosus]CAF3924102.1 unnamed protein product [Didymodactylos carnosus]
MEKSLLPANYGVAGLLIYNEDATADRNPPILANVHEDATYPALFLSYQAETTLVNAAQNLTMNTTVRIRISTEKVAAPIGNICAHTVTDDAIETIIIGSHSDGVSAGPGINDNGSGSATNPVLAPRNKLGPSIPNFVLSTLQIPCKILLVGWRRGRHSGSIRLTSLFRDWFTRDNLPYNMSEFNDRRDYGPFLAAGIVVSGLDAGAEGTKTKEERDYYNRMLGQGKGGIAGAIHDPCYHQAGDSLANINPLVYEKLTQGAAHVSEYLGRHSDLRSYLYPQAETRQLEKSSTNKAARKHNAQNEFYRKTDL